MKVLITGATGLIGKEIVRLCHQSDISVNYLTTRKEAIKSSQNYQGYYWDPVTRTIDESCFEGVEVIMNLVGATIAKRWTSSYKKEIIKSRTATASLLAQSLKNIKHTVRQVVSASAIGIYPDSFRNYYTEESTEEDTGFLGVVVKQWEEAVMEFSKIQIDVCLIRIGLVLAGDGGAYPKIAKPIKFGAGAAFGTGKQWQSWIHIEDLARLFLYAIKEELSGIYNGVAPNPVSNKKMTQVIADQLGKRLVLPNVPKIAMQLVLGEMHQLLFNSQRVGSNKIQQAGFRFHFDHIQQAVKEIEG